ncbi:HEXXH motif-containing putative peptide modification protein [Rossellomorea vietnamensis]|uniref:HEXXH motif-containing putative peptide modification protein n=1 Tax=Rossellomorea vietnamensis TaxID=218284 RepID=A0ACD4CD46_9BACI|nr:HEXXH motif-containing putative peptide modification protein [Rossellomorea vietnamensis]UXH46382.1 HEXXH motif-containing putative peptide modification protein [Rossellomorea vietnamensis]
MLSFLKPSSMENDQIYILGLRPFSQRVNKIMDIIQELDKIPSHTLLLLKKALGSQEFLKEIYSPGLNYFTYFLTTHSSDGMIYQDKSPQIIERMLTNNNLEKFINYLFLACAKYGITLQNKVELIEGSFEIPGFHYRIKLKDYSNFQACTIISSKNEIAFLVDDKIIGTVITTDDFNADFQVTGTQISFIRKPYDSKGMFDFELSEDSISQCLSENFNLLNVRNSELADNKLKSISFTPNDILFYESCLNTIKDVWPEYYLEIKGHIKLIGIMDTDAFGGFTTDILPDAIFISHHPYDFMWVTENLVHECAHSRLNQLFLIDPVVLNDHEERFKSPWRKDPRPMKGVFHGAYAFARVALWLERLYSVYKDNKILNRLEFVEGQLKEAIEVINTHGKLSPLGEHVFEEISSVIKTVPVVS